MGVIMVVVSTSANIGRLFMLLLKLFGTLLIKIKLLGGSIVVIKANKRVTCFLK